MTGGTGWLVVGEEPPVIGGDAFDEVVILSREPAGVSIQGEGMPMQEGKRLGDDPARVSLGGHAAGAMDGGNQQEERLPR